MARASAGAAPARAPRPPAPRRTTRNGAAPATAPKRTTRTGAAPATAPKRTTRAGAAPATAPKRTTRNGSRPATAPSRPRPATAPRRRSGPAAPARPAPGSDARRRTLVAGANGLLDRLLRGRLWVGCVGVLLAGIVFLNVGLLQLNDDIARTDSKAASMGRENAALRLRLARLDSTERIQQLAAERGFVMPAPGAVRYVTSRPGDARQAARKTIAPNPVTLAPLLAAPPSPQGQGIAPGTAAPGTATTTPQQTAAPAAVTPRRRRRPRPERPPPPPQPPPPRSPRWRCSNGASGCCSRCS